MLQRTCFEKQIIYSALFLLLTLLLGLKSFCLSLYGCSLWLISHKSLSDLQVVFNKVLRRVWHLPSMSHTSIVYCVSRIQNIVLKRSLSFYKRAMSSSSSLVRYIFYDSSALLYTVTGLNR